MELSSLVDQHSCKSRTATIRLWPAKFQMARLGKGINVTLWDFERIRISMMKETTARIFLTKKDGNTSGIYHTIGLDVHMGVAEQIEDRLGNKTEQQLTRKLCRITNNRSVARMKSYCARRYYPTSDIWWGRYSNCWTTAAALSMDRDLLGRTKVQRILFWCKWGEFVTKEYRMPFKWLSYVWTAKVQAPSQYHLLLIEG